MKTNLGPTSTACSSSWMSSPALGKEPLQAVLKRGGLELPITAITCRILRISRFDLLDLRDEVLSGRRKGCLLEFSISWKDDPRTHLLLYSVSSLLPIAPPSEPSNRGGAGTPPSLVFHSSRNAGLWCSPVHLKTWALVAVCFSFLIHEMEMIIFICLPHTFVERINWCLFRALEPYTNIKVIVNRASGVTEWANKRNSS